MRYYLLLILLLLSTTCSAQSLWSVEKGRTVVDQGLLDEVVAETITQFSISTGGDEFRVDVEKVSPPNLGVTSISGRIDGHHRLHSCS